MAESAYTLQWVPLSPKLSLPIGIWTPSDLWFLVPFGPCGSAAVSKCLSK